MDAFITAKEAGEILGLTSSRIHQFRRAGVLKTARQYSRYHLFARADIAELAVARALEKAGVPVASATPLAEARSRD